MLTLDDKQLVQFKAHLHLVKLYASRYMRRVPASVELDDLVQVGMIALAQAVIRYDDTKGASFATYASQRISYALADELRSADFLAKDQRRVTRDLKETRRRLSHTLGRQPTRTELAAASRIPLEEVIRIETNAVNLTVDVEPDDVACAQQTPDEELYRKQQITTLVAVLSTLPQKEQFIIEALYGRDLTLAEVGAYLGVSLQRVLQVRNDATARIALRLRAAGF
jgi:RNA polymerase sigma factor for flagellar operon FliA